MRNIAKSRVCSLAIVSGLLFSSMSHAALINRGGGMIYDSVLDITWLQDASYMLTSGAAATQFVNKATATNWVDSLVFGGFDDWRLPTMLPGNGTSYDTSFSFNGTTDRGFHNDGTNNELGHMFYNNLNNISFFSPSGVGNQVGSSTFNSSFLDDESGELVSFDNIGLTYWADPSNDPFANTSWGFNMQNFNGVATGEIQIHGLFSGLSVWAVRDGDVPSTLSQPITNPSTNIPEPTSFGLFAFGLAGFLAVRKQNRA